MMPRKTRAEPHRIAALDGRAWRQGGAARRDFVRRLNLACRRDGVFYLRHHGIAPAATRACFAAAADFFALSLEEKRRLHIARSPCHRGWFPIGGEILDADGWPQGDYKEGLKIGYDLDASHPRVRAGVPLHGPNQWPDEARLGLVRWKASMLAYYRACLKLARDLMHALALALDLPATYFDAWLTEPMATLAPLRYPPQPRGQIGAAPHTDFGCFTLLMQKDLPGMEVETDAGWQLLEARDHQLIVNLGDMLARWTNDYYRSPRHRVRNRSERARQSLAFFFDPDPDAPIAALPGRVRRGETPHYPPTTGLEHLLQKIDASFAHRQQP